VTASDSRQAVELGPRARLAADTIAMRPTRGIPTAGMNVMDVGFMESVTGHPPGAYAADPETVYVAFKQWAGACYVDQYIPANPLTMGRAGFESTTRRKATTGAERVVQDGMTINSPEAVVEHMERFAIPAVERAIAAYDPADRTCIDQMIAGERAVQARFGPDILKGPYSGGFQRLPYLRYTTYGYVNYFAAYALYPEVMARDFARQADLAVLCNTASARAILEGDLPRMVRLDHDMADSRGTLVDIRSLDAIWFPPFARSIAPLISAGVRLIWHCDGNLSAMVPRLIAAGVSGFQGFQYEDGMDYPAICRMTARDGSPLFIWAGVSVTTTLPHGTRQDVIDQLRWLVAHGPPVGLMLGASSSIVPGTPHGNIRALVEGLRYYREHGREGSADRGMRIAD